METEPTEGFKIEYARTDRSTCLFFNQKIPLDTVRLAALVRAPNSSRLIEKWYHTDCSFETVLLQGIRDGIILDVDDIQGVKTLAKEHQEVVLSWVNASISLVNELDLQESDASSTSTHDSESDSEMSIDSS